MYRSRLMTSWVSLASLSAFGFECNLSCQASSSWVNTWPCVFLFNAAVRGWHSANTTVQKQTEVIWKRKSCSYMYSEDSHDFRKKCRNFEIIITYFLMISINLSKSDDVSLSCWISQTKTEAKLDLCQPPIISTLDLYIIMWEWWQYDLSSTNPICSTTMNQLVNDHFSVTWAVNFYKTQPEKLAAAVILVCKHLEVHVLSSNTRLKCTA